MKKVLLKVFFIVIVLSLFVSCGFNYQKEYEKLVTSINNVNSASSLKSFLEKFEKFYDTREAEIEKLEEKIEKARVTKGLYDEQSYTKIAAIEEYDLDEFVYYITRNAKRYLEHEDQVAAAKTVYKVTSWGPKASLYYNEKVIESVSYSPSSTTVSFSDTRNKMDVAEASFVSIYSNNTNCSTDRPYSATISSPWGQDYELQIAFEYTFSNNSFGTEEFDSILVNTAEGGVLPTPSQTDIDDKHFVGWARGIEREGATKDSYYYTEIEDENFYEAGESFVPEVNVYYGDVKTESRDFYLQYASLDQFGVFVVDSNGNKNLKVNPGETVNIIPVIKNTGTIKNRFSIALGELSEEDKAKASIKGVGAYTRGQDAGKYLYPGDVFFRYSTDYYSHLNSVNYSNFVRDFSTRHSVYKSNNAYISLTVNKNVKGGDSITIPLIVTDGYGNKYNLNYQVRIYDYEYDISIPYHYFGDKDGNADGVVSPGETITLDYILDSSAKNDTLYELKNVLYSDNPKIRVVNNTTKASFLEPDEYSNSQYCDYTSFEKAKKGIRSGSNSSNMFVLNIASDIELGTYPLRIVTTDKFGNSCENIINMQVRNALGNLVLNKYEFVEDSKNSDKDGTINPGESFWIDIGFKNSGSGNLKNIKLVLSSDTEGVVVDPESKEETWSFVSSGKYINGQYRDYSKDTIYPTYGYKVNVGKSVEPGTTINLKWTLTCDGIKGEKTGIIKIYVAKVGSDFKYYNHSIYEKTGNGDGNVSPGETFSIDYAIRNVGRADSRANVKYRLYSEDPELIVTNGGPYTYDGVVNKGNVFTGEGSEYKYSDVRYFPSRMKNEVKVSTSAQVGSKKVLKVSINDGSNEWICDIPITIVKPDTNIIVDTYSCYDTGNGNDTPEIGEMAYYDFRIKNTGKAKGINLSATLTSETEGVLVTQGKYTYPNLEGGKYASIKSNKNTSDSTKYVSLAYGEYSNIFAIKVTNSVKEGTPVRLKFTVKDFYGTEYVRYINFTAQKPELGLDIEGIYYMNKKSYELVYPGEDLYFTLGLKNTTKGALGEISCKISSPSPYVTKSVYCTFPAPGAGRSINQRISADNLKLPISNSAPIGEKIEVNFEFSNDSGAVKSVKRVFEVGPKRFNPVVEKESRSGTNADGTNLIKAGSYIYYDAVIRNIGPVDGSDIKLEVTSLDEALTVNTPVINLGTIRSGRYQTFGDTINGYDSLDKAKDALLPGRGVEFKVSDDTTKGSVLKAKYVIKSGELVVLEKEISFYIQ